MTINFSTINAETVKVFQKPKIFHNNNIKLDKTFLLFILFYYYIKLNLKINLSL